MLFIPSKRSAIGLFCGLVVLGWLWYSAIGARMSRDAWSSGEYVGADNVLSGWRVGLCENVGVCGTWLGKHSKVSQKVSNRPAGKLIKAPNFVLGYAPYVYLHSEEKFMPGDIGEHLVHTTPYLNYTPITSPLAHHLCLSNLDSLNEWGTHVYLTSDDDPTNPPSWLRGDHNVPSGPGSSKDDGDIGLSSAPGIIIWTEKSGGIVDAFYFYFYSFNLGNTVAGWRFGNHVGDWEHTMVRFVDGQPINMFFSEHSGGSAYEYAVVEKIGKRPVAYSARGSHANYATPGAHYYAIPLHLLADHTDKGYLWDPAKNNYLYHYDTRTDMLTPDAKNLKAPTGWFHYNGRWGDRIYPLNDKRQYRVIGQYHFVNGPTGPKHKNLGRIEVCQNEGLCVVQPSLTYRLEGAKGSLIENDGDHGRWVDRVLNGQYEADVTVESGNKAPKQVSLR